MLLFAILHLLFILVTQGVRAASEDWGKSKEQIKSKRSQRAANAKAADANQQARIEPREMIVGGTVLLAMITTVLGLWVKQRVNERRRKEAESIVAKCVDGIEENWGSPPPHVDPAEGPLDVIDNWDRPLELFVDEYLLGTLLTVRSAGADGKSGTIDDVLSVRLKRAKAVDVGRELGHRVVDKTKDELGDLKERFGEKADEMKEKLAAVIKRHPEDSGPTDDQRSGEIAPDTSTEK